jgi:hypothetical protein
MNYIPGFSNYLETTVPRYAVGGRVMDGEPMMYRNEPMFGDEYNMFGSEMMLPPMDQYAQPMMYGDPMAAAAPVMDAYQQAAVEPVTQEAAPAETAAPYDLSALAGLDLSGLNSLYGMNFGSNFGGGAMGGQYQDDPNLQYIGAPLSNKGNATSQTGGNTFAVRADQPVRLVDHRTNQIVFEGTGFDAARKATELGQGLTNQFGRKANYSIQTADPTGNYSTVAYEKKNKSTLGQIANVAGTVLPLAMIPLTMGMSAPLAGLSTAGKIALGAGLGGLGSGLKGDNILKGAAMGGLSAAGGQLLGAPLGKIGDIGLRAGTAIGTGLGATAGGLATGQSLKNSLLGGVASGALSYVTPDIVKGLGINQAPSASTSTGAGTGGDAAVYGGPNAEIIVNATPSISTPNVNLGGFKTPTQKYLNEAASDDFSDPRTGQPYNSGYDGDLINVTGSVPNAVTGGLSLGGQTGNPVVDRLVQPEVVEPSTEDIIKVTGQLPGAVTGGLTGSSAVDRLVQPAAEEPYAEDLIKVTGQLPGAVTGGLNALTATAPAVLPNDIVVDATTAKTTPVVPITDSGNPVVNGVDQVTKEIVATAPKVEQTTPVSVPITGGLTLEPELLSEVDKLSEAEKEAKKNKLGLEEYLRIAGLISGLVGGSGDGSGQTGTYGGSGTGRLNPIFSAKLPSAGGLGSIGAARTARPLGDQDWLTYGTRPELNFFDYAAQNNPAPVTTPVPGNPAGPIMEERDPMAMAKGGRSTFAVNGPGTGRSDDIPAVLSDGEYVIDAETVALLGDGSSKAGAKKLDDLRVKVRKHKGQKLAKGRFSANAKKPEAYLSGGRI